MKSKEEAAHFIHLLEENNLPNFHRLGDFFCSAFFLLAVLESSITKTPPTFLLPPLHVDLARDLRVKREESPKSKSGP